MISLRHIGPTRHRRGRPATAGRLSDAVERAVCVDRWPVVSRRLGAPLGAFALAVVLGACGGDDADPTPTLAPPTVTSAAGQSADTPATSPAASPADPAALQPGEVTLGQLADRIAAAWPSVTSYRSETVDLLGDGSPVPNALTVTREVLLPDRKRFVVVEGDTATEIVYVGNALFTRVGDGPWTPVDTSALAANDRFRQAYAQMTGPVQAPFSGVSERERERIGREGAVTSEGGRSCREHIFPEVGAVGERIEITVLIDAAGLPCSIETLAGSTRNRTTFQYNVPVTIDAPAGVAASPVASPIPDEESQHET